MTDENKLGRHELFDRSSMLAEMVDAYLINHGGLKGVEYRLAKDAFEALWKLRQTIGARTTECRLSPTLHNNGD